MDKPIEKYCRLCAQLKPCSKLINLITDTKEHFEFMNKLNRINANIDLFDEIVPKAVCLVCKELLERAYSFVLGIEKSQEVLREVYSFQQVKIEEFSLVDSNEDYPTYEKQSIKIETHLDAPNYVKNIKNLHCDLYNDSTLETFKCLCAYCDTQFANIEELNAHSLKYHSSCNSFRCVDCHKRIYHIDKVQKHMCTHNKDLKLFCFKCRIPFENIAMLKKHKSTHVMSNIVCAGCGTLFTSQEDLKQHQQIYYSTRIKRIIPDKLKQTGLMCKLCGKITSSPSTLTAHLLTHTERKRNHICEVCGKRYLRKYDLERHNLVHVEVRAHECVICKMSFKTEQYLQVHLTLHEKNKRFVCKICGKEFRLQKQVNFHQIVHSNTLPYECDICGKAFRFKSKLKLHTRQHTGFAPYSCDICQRNFKDWSNYAKHMKVAHSKNVSKRKNIIEVEEIPLECRNVKKRGRPKLNKGKKDDFETEK